MRILVIDDDPGVRLLCRLNLSRNGHEVLEAASGGEGLGLLAAPLPDVVVLDVMMPYLDGFEVLRQIRACSDTSRVPVVLLSARVGIADQIEGWTAGADDYVIKPFSPAALAVALHRASHFDPEAREAEREARLGRLTVANGLEGLPGHWELLRELRAVSGRRVVR